MVKTSTQLSNTNYRRKDNKTRNITLSNTNYRGKDSDTRKIEMSNTNYRGKDDNKTVYYQLPW